MLTGAAWQNCAVIEKCLLIDVEQKAQRAKAVIAAMKHTFEAE